jgi:diazepam-binding inhibitor (GABA receptor modulator, acyl-CoA-binding protein)
MTDTTQAHFAQAQQDIKNLDERPSNAMLLKLYALYKQGSAGDVSGERPGGFDFAGGAKYDAWTALRGQTQEQAQQGYIALVQQLLSE